MALLSASTWAAWRQIWSAPALLARVTASSDLQLNLADLQVHLQDVEIGTRSFLLTGETSFFQQTTAARAAVNRQFLLVRGLARDPLLQTHADVLDGLIAQALSLSQAQIELGQRSGLEVARQLAIRHDGNTVTQRIHTELAAMNAREQTLLDQRRTALIEEQRQAQLLAAIADSLSFVLLITASAFLVREIRLRRQSQQQLQRWNDELEQRVQAQTTELRRSNDLLDRMGEVAKIGGWALDPSTQSLHWTRETYRIHEVDPTYQPSFETAIQFYEPAARPLIAAAVQAAIETGEPFDLELPLVTAQGRQIWVRAQGGAERADGKTVRIYGAFQDITERRGRQESQRLQSAAVHAAADAIVITDRAGTIVFVNPAFTQLTGFAAEEALGKNPRDLIRSGKHTQEFFAALWSTILRGHTWRGEVINRKKDGSLYTERQVITPILDASGDITHFVAIKQDLTERLLLEAQFHQAQKMETVGRLASGIAHDFNNLLTVIIGMADLTLVQLGEDHPASDDIREIHAAGQRAAALTRQLLAFSRQQLMSPRVLNLNTVVGRMERMLQRLLGEDIDLRVVPAVDLWSVKADPGQVEQVITNLAVNARDAMPQGGQLTIESQNVEIDESYARQHGAAVPPGSYVRLVVSDSGVGMDDATRARIFEPFFTTKASGRGTGLGLSTVYGIVKQSLGFVWAYSEPGHGTSFTILLPRVSEVADGPQETSVVSSHGGSETLLLVEDNVGLRKLAIRFLEPAGYTVLSAPAADEAIHIAEHHDGPIHLLLTDVVMPGMSGRQLAERLLQGRPATKVLYMSGYTDDTIVRHGLLAENVHFIQKPFNAATLLKKVREVLESSM